MGLAVSEAIIGRHGAFAQLRVRPGLRTDRSVPERQLLAGVDPRAVDDDRRGAPRRGRLLGDRCGSGPPGLLGRRRADHRALVNNLATPSATRALVQFAFDNFSVSVLPASLACDNVDECAANHDNCAPEPAGVCTNTIGGYTCACANGYAGDGVTCRALRAVRELAVDVR